MPIQFVCENCQKNLKVPDSAAGKKGRCNKCGHLNTVPTVAADGFPTPTVGGSNDGSETYNVKSAVNGDVFGPADAATLQEWLGEGRITPNCQLQKTGSNQWTMASQMFSSLGAAAGVSASTTATPRDPFAQFQQPSEGLDASADLNPYAPTLSPHNPNTGPTTSGEIVPTSGDIGFCISHGWNKWTENFGILLAVSGTMMGINYGFGFLQGLLQAALEAGGSPVMLAVGLAVIVIISGLVQLWLNLGCTKLICNLCRGQRTEYAMLFTNARKMPVVILFYLMLLIPFAMVGGGFAFVAAVLLEGGNQEAGIGVVIAFVFLFVAFMLVSLLTWPVYFLLADTDLPLGEALSKGIAVGRMNMLTSIPVGFVAFLVMFMGIFACFVGIIATIPAGQAIIASAYLNMSGQLRKR